LDGRQEQPDQHRNDRDDDEELDERETCLTAERLASAHDAMSSCVDGLPLVLAG
jgi:hypothetical protein